VIEPLLQVRGLTKRYPVGRANLLGRRHSFLSALDGVDLDVARGESVGVVGESGSGKTTLARLLVRLIRPTAGSILFDGIDFATADRVRSRELHRRIQIVFQDPQSSLDPRMRVDAIVAEGLYHSPLDRAQRRRRVGDLLELVGLSAAVMRNYPHQLSGGQRQRVGIARALAAEPDLLIADEPVSALDASVQGQILNLLRGLQRERHLSLVFVAHELPVARFMSDRIAVMHLGKIVELAAADEVFDRPAHPYTQALLAAMPTYGQARASRRALEGDIPSAIDPPACCRFASRCFRRIERCTAEEPPLAPVDGTGHEVACFNYELASEEARWALLRSSS
jgi:oligopeptide/dipeptide ABC transporter ATP-binding protein